MIRQANFQTISWFWDLHKRQLLDLDPPYQRRSVWNQEYKDYFIDTVLNGFPAPAIFPYQEITPEGLSRYSVVDGKQRLSTLFEFANNEFIVSEKATVAQFRGKYFKDLDPEVKTKFWSYQFSVEYLPSSDEKIINNIFDRINRNVAKLSPQELRHARFDGVFISEAESLTEWMAGVLPPNFPSIAQRSRKQMKDVELVAQLLLLIEEGPKSYSQDDLDKAFSDRDQSWDLKEETIDAFKNTIRFLAELLQVNTGDPNLARSRIKNQTDFYSLFGAIHELLQSQQMPELGDVAQRLQTFLQVVEESAKREQYNLAKAYHEAARSASNDAGPRRARIDIIKDVIAGKFSLKSTA
ncbi:DUF262 domain-containing protein [Kyrpidia spormannii]|uniref:GmrSD restriction endonucleases N-terminal domain-containing protein n=1 Tax=Kyrpidia spormannii TaxID=2055160 RepID=A0A6F9EGX4_9BACL|nr:DUF262 domain-containing protein [Kyrpidia spormannii]CAB3395663.1 conserved protein of unknown function [Kyrpidia spormannii]